MKLKDKLKYFGELKTELEKQFGNKIECYVKKSSCYILLPRNIMDQIEAEETIAAYDFEVIGRCLEGKDCRLLYRVYPAE